MLDIELGIVIDLKLENMNASSPILVTSYNSLSIVIFVGIVILFSYPLVLFLFPLNVTLASFVS